MPLNYSSPVEPILASLRNAARAYAMGSMLHQQTQQQATLDAARAYQAQMAGNKSAADTDTINYLLQLRRQSRDTVPKDKQGMELSNILTLQASGKPYEPYTAIGTTGGVLDRTTGQVTDPMGFFREAQQRMNQLQAAQAEHAYAQAQKARSDAASPLRQWEIEQKKVDIENKRAQITAREQATQDKQAEKNARAEEALVALATTRDAVKTLLNDKGLSSGAGWGSELTSYLNGSAGAAYRAQLENAKKLWARDSLGVLKSQSSSGATGYGNMNIKEFDTLSAAAAPVFDPRLSKERHKKALEVFLSQLEDTYQRMAKHRPQAQAAIEARQQTVNDTKEPTNRQKFLEQLFGY